MKNKEKYAKEIIEIAIKDYKIGVETGTGAPKSCADLYCKDCSFHDDNGQCHRIKGLRKWANEEYQESILDGFEKKYLSEVIKPFKDDIISISKHTILPKSVYKSYIFIKLKNGNMDFPPFKTNTLYKGMEDDKEYTLKELGL